MLLLSGGTLIFEENARRKTLADFYHKHSFKEAIYSTRNEKNRRTVSLVRYIN